MWGKEKNTQRARFEEVVSEGSVRPCGHIRGARRKCLGRVVKRTLGAGGARLLYGLIAAGVKFSNSASTDSID